MFPAQSRQTFSGTITDEECPSADHSGIRSTPVRLAQALERMEAATRTLVDADDQPHLAVR